MHVPFARHVLQLYAITSIPLGTFRFCHLANKAYSIINRRIDCALKLICMVLTLEIHRKGTERTYFRVYNDTDIALEDITGSGWTVKDALDDFIKEVNRLSFYDDDLPLFTKRDSIRMDRILVKND